MFLTLAALTPGLVTYIWYFGIGVVLNILLAALIAVGTEATLLALRGQSMTGIKDGSALLTGILIAACLPPLMPYWMVVLGVVFAIVFGKQIYGGTGNNVFNPAMVGFAVLVISFPAAISYWPAPEATNFDSDVITQKLTADSARATPDAITAATPLDAYKFRAAITNEEFFDSGQLQNWSAWVWINIAYLIGGLLLIYRKIIPWQTPAAFLGTLAVLSACFYDGGSSASLGSPVFHLFSGAAMLAAFFILTDPVTCPGHIEGLWIFGMGIGVLTFIIRTQGAYPEGIAFSVLLMNAASPAIDHYFSSRRARQ